MSKESKTDKGKTDNCIQINEDGAKILMTILENERKGITLAELTEIMPEKGVSRNITYSFINEALNDPRGFLVGSPWKRKSSRGRKSQLLEIDPNQFMTSPKTALIMIELAEFQKDDLIVKEEFIKFIMEKYKFDKESINGRLNFLDRVGEISFGNGRSGTMWIVWRRYRLILPYLELLVTKNSVT